MKVTTEKIDNTKIQLMVEISPEEFEESLQKAYHKVVKKVNVPGFRKGKVPRRILENMYGKEILLEDALQDAVPKAYLKAVDEIEEEYTPVSEPEYEMVESDMEKPITFKATIDIKPDVTLGEYKGLDLTKPSSEIKDEDVEAELNKIQQRYAKLAVVEGPAVEGDVLTIDFVGKVDGQPFDGGTAEDYPLEIGSHTFIPGFEEQLIGINKEETKDVEVKFPEEYQSEDLAGKDAVFTTTVKEIKRKEVAPLDDEFAKDVSEFETMQELRTDIENKLKESAEKKAENDLRNSAIEKAAENAQVDIPESMIKNRVRRMVEDFAYRVVQQGFSLEQYLQATGQTIEDMENMHRPSAEASVRSDLVLEKIAKVEEIKVSSEELDQEINKIAEQVKQESSQVRELLEKQGQISSLEFGIMIDKAVDLIINEAKIS